MRLGRHRGSATARGEPKVASSSDTERRVADAKSAASPPIEPRDRVAVAGDHLIGLALLARQVKLELAFVVRHLALAAIELVRLIEGAVAARAVRTEGVLQKAWAAAGMSTASRAAR